MLDLLSTAKVKQLFGSFQWRSTGGSSIEILGNWVKENIVTVYVPELDRVPTFGGLFSGRVQFHKNGVNQLLKAFRDCSEWGVVDDIIFWAGSFVPRRVRGSSQLSRHSWGIAFDVNSEQNPFKSRPVGSRKLGSLHRVVPCFEDNGFVWGGRWTSTPDGMHFELAEIDRDLVLPVMSFGTGVVLKINDRVVDVPIALHDGMSYCKLGDLFSVLKKTTSSPTAVVPVAQILKSEGYTVTWHGEQGRHGTIYAYR